MENIKMQTPNVDTIKKIAKCLYSEVNEDDQIFDEITYEPIDYNNFLTVNGRYYNTNTII